MKHRKKDLLDYFLVWFWFWFGLVLVLVLVMDSWEDLSDSPSGSNQVGSSFVLFFGVLCLMAG